MGNEHFPFRSRICENIRLTRQLSEDALRLSEIENFCDLHLKRMKLLFELIQYGFKAIEMETWKLTGKKCFPINRPTLIWLLDIIVRLQLNCWCWSFKEFHGRRMFVYCTYYNVLYALFCVYVPYFLCSAFFVVQCTVSENLLNLYGFVIKCPRSNEMEDNARGYCQLVCHFFLEPVTNMFYVHTTISMRHTR